MTRAYARTGLARGARLLAAVLLMPLMGCYAYIPTDFATPANGEIIRADLTARGSEEVVSRFGPGLQQIEGMTLENDGQRISILVDGVKGRQGNIPVDATTVNLSRDAIATVYQKKFSTLRSLVFGAAVIGGAFLAVEGLDYVGRQFDDEDIGDPGPGPSFRIPFRLPLPFGGGGR